MYKAFSDNVEVIGRKVLAVVNSHPTFKDLGLEILAKHGLSEVDPAKWYKQQNWLNVFSDIKQKFGSSTIFNIGKSAVTPRKEGEIAKYTLKESLDNLDEFYKKCHRGGDVGYYKLLKFDAFEKIAIMECKNPYPDDFDRGMLTATARSYKPIDSLMIDVKLDTSKPNRLAGALVSTYIITW
jgi:hypothetical protein